MADSVLTGAINAVDLPALIADLYPDSGARPGKRGTVTAVWRDEDEASFSLYQTSSSAWMFKDHGTGQKGNTFHFLTDILEWNPQKASEEIIDRASDFEAVPTKFEKTQGPQPCPAIPVAQTVREEHRKRYISSLKEHRVPKTLSERGFGLKDISKLGIGEQDGDAYLPITGPDGSLLNIKRRKSNPQGKNDRYRGLTGHGSPAWCSRNLSSSRVVIIVEGELNGMAVYLALNEGDEDVAVMGAAGANMNLHLEALKDKVVYVYGDGDEAGQRAAHRWAYEAHEAGAEKVFIMEGQQDDACDVQSQHGRSALRDLYKDLMEDAHPLPVDVNTGRDRNSPDLFLYSRTEYGDAERVLARDKDILRYVPGMGFFYWDEQRWRYDPEESMVTSCVIDMARQLQAEAAREQDNSFRKTWTKHAMSREKFSTVRSIIRFLKTFNAITIQAKELDADPMLMNVKNGTIDLRTGELRKHNPKDLITKMAYVHHDPKSPPPERWLRFQETICGEDDELLSYKQRAMGYSLTGSTAEEVLFICHGTGANGKSTEQHVLDSLLGDYAATAQFSTFAISKNEGPRTDIARLQGSRYVAASEGSATHQLDEGLVKQATGQDSIVARFLYQREFEFRPSWKIWLATNHKPQIKGVDEGIWRRVRLIPYTVTIPPRERDRTLRKKLEEEKSQILNWLVQGCLEWQRVGLGKARAVEGATEQYQRESDVLADFVTQCCELSADYYVSSKELYNVYRAWAKQAGEYVRSQNKFGRLLSERGFETSKVRIGNRIQTVRTGLRLSDEGETLAATGRLEIGDDLMG